MYYVFIFDFALVGLLLSAVVFFVWCWIGFMEDRRPHPIHRQSMAAQHKPSPVKVEGRHYA